MNRKIYIIIILAIISNAACKEIYYPELDVTGSSLVVEGLITDEPGAYSIKLSKSVSFNGSSAIPEQGAKVFITDTHGNTFNFEESLPGTYKSDPAKFISQYGEQYTLIIQTRDRKAYRSSPQILYPKGTLDSLHSVIKTAIITTYFGEGGKLTSLRGAEFQADIDLKNDPSPYYRFSNSLLIEYESKDAYFSPDSAQQKTLYCWKQYTPYEFLNLSERHNSSYKTQQLLGFCPIDTTFYEVISIPVFRFDESVGQIIQVGWTRRKLQLYMISFRQFHLNPDIYRYYRSVNDQLAARQQVLDPVSVQTTGNIICTTNPEEPVLGIFEVSSINIYSYIYRRELGSTVDLQKIDPIDLSKFADANSELETPPNFWKY